MLDILKRITKILAKNWPPEPLAVVEQIKRTVNAMAVFDFFPIGAVISTEVIQLASGIWSAALKPDNGIKLRNVGVTFT
jgi:hypothetical protein